VAKVTITRRRLLNYPQAHDVGRSSASGSLAEVGRKPARWRASWDHELDIHDGIGWSLRARILALWQHDQAPRIFPDLCFEDRSRDAEILISIKYQLNAGVFATLTE